MIVCGGITFEDTPVELREKVAVAKRDLPAALKAMKQKLGLKEGVLLSTCNRVEYFGLSESEEQSKKGWLDFLKEFHQTEEDFSRCSFQYEGRKCVEHLFEVASGLKSMVIGETEIFGQVKEAYMEAHRLGESGKWINRLFQSSFQAAKAARSQTHITRGGVSVGSVAVELAERIFGKLKKQTVVILGAGETSEKTAKTLRSRGAESIFVSNRTYERAAVLAEKLEGQAIHWEEWEEVLPQVDIIISSTSAPHYILTKERIVPFLTTRGTRPLFLIDLAVPRDFHPQLHNIEGVYLYDIDDLQKIAERNLHERLAESLHAEQILKPHVEKFLKWMSEVS